MMERHRHQKFEEKDMEKKTEGSKTVKEESKEGQSGKQAQTSSASSSPAHDFSFTVSLHNTFSSATTPDKSKPPPSFALDLSPADDIFFHGHLLPLHLLSHLPVSPRSSTTSMDSFTLPVGDYGSITSSNKSNFTMDNTNKNNSSSNSSNNSSQESRRNSGSRKGGSKSKSFSIFGFTRGRKEFQVTQKEGDDKEKHKRKVRLDVVRVVKKYLRMVQPLVIFRGRKEKIRQSYSYSGNLSTINKRDVVKGRRGEYSAPASMRTSPTNSGLLFPTSTFPPASDSTMEELQAAIQAAIAHCKNSIAKDDKVKC